MRTFKALIVDDSITIRKIIKANLVKLGIGTVLEASNGDEGLKAAFANKLDVIFLDYNMPGMNGLDLTNKLRTDSRTQGVKIVAVSSEFDEQLISKFKEEGVYDFIEKPFDLAKFNSAIKPVLSKSDENVDGTKVTKDILIRLFSTPPVTTIDEKNIIFTFGNEKVSLLIDRFIDQASHSIEIQDESDVA